MKITTVLLWTLVLISLGLSVTAVCRTFPANLCFDYYALIFTALSILVTVLIGYQVAQSLSLNRRMEEIASQAVNQSSRVLANDIRQIIWASRHVFLARSFIVEEEKSKAIHYYFKAMDEYRNIYYSNLRDGMASDLVSELYKCVKDWSDDGSLSIYLEYKEHYLRLLDEYTGDVKSELKKLLDSARTK